MSLERIAVATAVLSTAVSAAGLLLTWYRGSTTRRPRLARILGGVTLGSMIVLIVALLFARGGDSEAGRPPSRALSAGEYRLRVARICEEHERDAQRIERAEGKRPVFGATVQLETRTTDKLKAVAPPSRFESDHQAVLALWGRRLSLLGYYYDRSRSELSDPDFRRRFTRDLIRVDELSAKLQKRFAALGVTPECNLF
jgi:hypothetical protein